MSKHIGSNFDDFLEEEGIVINITLDDVINDNLQDMGITAQLTVYKHTAKSLAKENKELRLKIKHTEDLLNQALKELEVLQW